MSLPQSSSMSDIEMLDHHSEADRDRSYANTTLLDFEFDEERSCSEFGPHFAAVVALTERLAGREASVKLDLSNQPAPQRTTWALVDDKNRGVILHHDAAVMGKAKDEGEYVGIFWSTVGLPQAFAVCYQFGRAFLKGIYDVNLAQSVEVYSSLPSEEHEAAVNEFINSMASLGFKVEA